MADAGNWCLIESDPGVFSELIRDFGKWATRGITLLPCQELSACGVSNINIFVSAGVQGVQVEELWSLDSEQFENLK